MSQPAARKDFDVVYIYLHTNFAFIHVQSNDVYERLLASLVPAHKGACIYACTISPFPSWVR